MAFTGEDLSSSSSEDDLDSIQSSEEELESDMGHIAQYDCEPLASSDENGGGLDGDEDGLSAATLEQRFDKTVPISAWYVKILLCFVMYDSGSGKFKAQSDLKTEA